MDTASLELAAQRYREAVAALEAAAEDLKREAAETVRTHGPEGEAAVTRITGWTSEQLRARTAASPDTPDPA